jgi:purine-nucleoside/S-methyl-5'-thioadenosine phosphorylase / adenosine deaminase
VSEALRAPGLGLGGIAHGFAAAGEPVPPAYQLVRVRQVHGAAVAWASDGSPSPAGEADALVTDRPGLAVAVSTADCVPILVAAPAAGVVAAVHAGWRGTLAGIVSAVLDGLRARHGVRADEIRVALGPAIDGCCFEIERDIAARFADRFGADVWRAWRDGRSGGGVARGTLDLRAVNRRLLVAAGVLDHAIELVGPCTCCGDAPFASYRRDGANAGRQLSWIALAPAG